MARWKLMSTHFLNVPDNKWEYKEVDRKTGREKRMQITVPLLLDTKDPQCWTNQWGNKDNQEGEIIVCHGDPGDTGDRQFIGDPTPDMMPIDDEARALSAKFEKRWEYKPEDIISAQGYSQSLVDRFQTEMAVAQSKPAEVPGLADLVAAIGKLVEHQATTRRA